MRDAVYTLLSFLPCALSESKRQPIRTLKRTGLPALSLAVECTSQAPVFSVIICHVRVLAWLFQFYLVKLFLYYPSQGWYF